MLVNVSNVIIRRCVDVCAFACVHVCVCLYLCICVCVYVCVCVCVLYKTLNKARASEIDLNGGRHTPWYVLFQNVN